jgi:hypothetical protein
MKSFFFILTYFVALASFAQTKHTDTSKTVSFVIPTPYQSQYLKEIKSDFIFVNNIDTTSLVVAIKFKVMDKDALLNFKNNTNEAIERSYFIRLKNPKIVTRGEVAKYKDKSIYFFIKQTITAPAENEYMLSYLFYHKGKEINFIFRTKERRLKKVMPKIQAIINSLKFLE